MIVLGRHPIVKASTPTNVLWLTVVLTSEFAQSSGVLKTQIASRCFDVYAFMFSIEFESLCPQF